MTTCEACQAAVDLSRATYDAQGRLLCRSCSALDQVASADRAIAKGEERRICAACGEQAQIAKATVYKTRSGAPLFDQQTYQCGGCRRRFTTSSGLALALLSIAMFLPTLLIAGMFYPYGLAALALVFAFIAQRIHTNAKNPLVA